MKLWKWAVVAAAVVLPACSCNNNGGKCTVDNNCSKGVVCCNGGCADPQTDRDNCGTCGTKCGTQNAASECVAAICHLTCQSGFGNCNNSPVDGCETKLSDSAANCGQCGHSCAAPHSQGVCLSGQCASGACEMGFKDCNTSRTDGCETPVSASPTDCGECGRVCQPMHTTGRCGNGTCTIGTCDPGFDNCNGLSGDGCETDLSSDPNHCGDCATVCDANLKCVSGHCGSSTLLLYGGLSDIMSSVPVDALTRFDTTTHQFLQLTTTGTSPGGRFGHLAVWDAAANRMLVWGGFNSAGAGDTSIYALDFNQAPPAWSTLAVTTAAPVGRAFMEYGFDQDNRVIYLFGGGDSAGGSLSETWKFDVKTLAWSQLPAGGPSRSFGVGAFENGRFIVGLGVDFSTQQGIPGFAAIDSSGAWVSITEMGTVPGERLGIQTLGDASPLVIFGGYDPSSTGISDSRTFISDESDGGLVFNSPSYPLVAPDRAYGACAAGSGRRYLFGGYLAALGVGTNDLWSLDLDAGWAMESDGGALPNYDAGFDADAGFPVVSHPGLVLPTMVAR